MTRPRPPRPPHPPGHTPYIRSRPPAPPFLREQALETLIYFLSFLFPPVLMCAGGLLLIAWLGNWSVIPCTVLFFVSAWLTFVLASWASARRAVKEINKRS